MFLELNSFLDFDSPGLPNGFVFVSSNDLPDHGFVLNHLLMLYLKTGRKVFQVNFVNQEAFYSSTCQRLGIRLKAYAEKKAYFNFDCLRLLKDYISGSTLDASHPFAFIRGARDKRQLKSMGYKILSCAREFLGDEWEKSQVLVMLDDLTSLQTMGVPNGELLKFLHLLRSQLCGRLVVGGKWTQGDTECHQLCCYLSHLADVNIHIQGLPTGYSQDINGQISVTHKDSRKQEKRKKMHFRLEDKGVKLFPIGFHRLPVRM